LGNEEQEALLEWLLSYELKLAARFRYYVALVYTKPTDHDCSDLKIDQLFENDMRDCDQYFTLGDNNAILMAHTSLEEAQQAIARYKKVCNGTMDLRYSVAIYPNSPTAESMMETARERLEKAVESQYGAVVDGE
jgi:hypothetical protein